MDTGTKVPPIASSPAAPPPTDPSAPSPAEPAPPAWQSFAHLWVPVATILLLVTYLPDPIQVGPLVLFSVVPAHFVASQIYPSNHPPPTPEENVVFTRRHWGYRAAVLFTYGRLYGTPFRLANFIPDIFLDELLRSYLIPDRGADEPQRRSEFLIAALWTTVTLFLSSLIPATSGLLWTLVMSADRIMWRASYMGLVDDLVKVLGYPNFRTWKGRSLVILVQFTFIYLSVCLYAVKFSPSPEIDDGADILHDLPAIDINQIMA